MPIADDQTKDVALHANDSTSNSPKPITSTFDGVKRRLDVAAEVTIPTAPTDQLILTVLGEIRDELKKLNVKFNIVYELDKLDAREEQ